MKQLNASFLKQTNELKLPEQLWLAILFPLQLGLLCPQHQETSRRAMACLEITHLYFLLAIARCWFARCICLKTHGHSFQVKKEWYCVQVLCLFLGGCWHHCAAKKQLWRKWNHGEPKPWLVRGAHVTRDTLLGCHSMLKEVGTAPRGLLPWAIHCVKETKG